MSELTTHSRRKNFMSNLVNVIVAVPKADEEFQRVFHRAGYDVYCGWTKMSSHGHFTPVSAGRELRRRGWWSVLEWFSPSRRLIFADLNDHKGVFSLSVYGQEYLEKMTEIAHEVAKRCEVKIEVVLRSDSPRFEETYDGGYE